MNRFNLNEESQELTSISESMLPSVDYVLVFSNTHEHSAIHEICRERFLQNLKQEGLEWEIDRKQKLSAVKIHATSGALRKYSELLRWKLPASHCLLKKYEEKEASKQTICVEKTTTAYKVHYYYSQEMDYLFEDKDPKFFPTGLKIVVISHILENTRFDIFDKDGEATPPPNTKNECGLQKLIHDEIFVDAFPLHDGSLDNELCLRSVLLKEWSSVRHWYNFQPLDKIQEYFGVQIALYYAWLGFYTLMLIPLSIIGFICFFYGWATMSTSRISQEICDTNNTILICPQCDKDCDYWRLQDTCTYTKLTYLFDNNSTVFLAGIVCLWTTLLMELWKRYSAELVHNWGLSDYTKRLEPERPQYLEYMKKFAGEEYQARCYTDPPRPLRYIYSYSVTILGICLVLITTFGVIVYRMSLNAADSLYGHKDSITYKITVLPVTGAVINLLAIRILSYFYWQIAVFLTEKELHRTQNQYDESLSLKIYLFQFFNHYSCILYIALLKGKFIGHPAKYNRLFGLRQEECGPAGCMFELCLQLFIIMVGKQILYTIQEKMWEPLLSMVFEVWDIINKSKEKCNSQWCEDRKLNALDAMALFNEYLEVIMQFGFVTLFVVAFPLAPFFALLSNVLELRWDAEKFLRYYRRPIPKRARSIGMWHNVLNILARLSVITNAFIIAFTSNFIPKLLYYFEAEEGTSYLDFTLAKFATKDFEIQPIPSHESLYNETDICYYQAYRYPPDHVQKYMRSNFYWHVLAARLAFVVAFQNFAGSIQLFVDWCIPDVPARVKERIRQEEDLFSKILNKEKYRKQFRFEQAVKQINVRRRKETIPQINIEDEH